MSTGADDDEGEGERPLNVTTPNAINCRGGAGDIT
jgi:hypothetical protein